MFSISEYPIISALFVTTFAIPSLLGLIKSQGMTRGTITYILLALFALAIEYLALRTGFPYGHFEYKATLGGKLLGILPLSIIFAYPPLVIGSYALAQRLALPPKKRIFASMIFLLLIDLVLDPGAVSTHMWTYQFPGAYYGVPITNFLGWILTGSLAPLILLKLPQSLPPITIHGLVLIIIFWLLINLLYLNLTPVVIGCALLLIIKRILNISAQKPTKKAVA